MADVLLQGDGAARAAEALLRVNGGRAVLLRMPASAAAGDDAEQLGLATPGFQDTELAPAVFRQTGSVASVLVSGEAMAGVAGSLQLGSVQVLFETALAIVVDGVIYAIERVAPQQAYGTTLCYVVTLRQPLA